MQNCVRCVTSDCALVQETEPASPRSRCGLVKHFVRTQCMTTAAVTLSLDTKRDFRSRCSVWRCRDDVSRVLNKKRQVDIMGG